MSCSEENEYQIALKEYVKEDIAINANRKEYELFTLKDLAEEKPEKFESMYKEAVSINPIVSKFENFLLKSDTLFVDAILKTYNRAKLLIS